MMKKDTFLTIVMKASVLMGWNIVKLVSLLLLSDFIVQKR